MTEIARGAVFALLLGACSPEAHMHEGIFPIETIKAQVAKCREACAPDHYRYNGRCLCWSGPANATVQSEPLPPSSR
jgi:hypothetical protein